MKRRHAPWSWEAITACCCFAGGIMAAFVGSVLTAMTWIVGAPAHPWVRGFGTALLILTIPLLIFAGYCLDWLEHKPRKPLNSASRNREDGHISIAHVFAATIFLGGILVAPVRLTGQQTVFNVPTTDVLEPGKIYAELDVTFKPDGSQTVGSFSSFVPRIVIGVGGDVEVGLNLTGNIQPGSDPITLVTTAKWKPYQGKDNGLALVLGNNLFIPVRNRGYNIGNYFYVELSKTFKSSTRVTIGGYDFTRNVVAPANRAGSQFGFEQPLNKKLTIAADWFTGKHSAGYFTPGFIFKASSKVTGYAGYSIGNRNASRGNHFFLLEVGYNF